jgi:hypothetical protein
MVSCGGASAVTDGQGRYSLRSLRGNEFACVVAVYPYVARVTHVRFQRNGSYTLDFGAPAVPQSDACAPTPAGQRCGALALQPGSISGAVVDEVTRKPVNSAEVICWDNSVAARSAMENPTRYSAFTSPQGLYFMPDVPAGLYECVAASSETPLPVAVRPNAPATRKFAICQRHCPGVTSHDGDVMHTLTMYLIFWTPPGTRLDPNISDARYRALVSQFIQDLGGTRFYGLLTQYWDFSGPVRNVVRLGGTFVDTHPYPHAGTRANPLSDGDIFGEIASDTGTLHWPLAQGTTAVAVFTAYGIQACTGTGSRRMCSFPLGNSQEFCAYHAYATLSDYSAPDVSYFKLAYMLIPNVPMCYYLPTFSEAPTPYGSPHAAVAIDSFSHEIFETVSDPYYQGWYGANLSDTEIGDKCETSYGYAAPDGSTVRLANGHGYALQREWSNATNTCSYG